MIFFTALPIGEYAAVTLLLFFGLKAIKDAWDLPSDDKDKIKDGAELGEFTEAEELVKEKVRTHYVTRIFSSALFSIPQSIILQSYLVRKWAGSDKKIFLQIRASF